MKKFWLIFIAANTISLSQPLNDSQVKCISKSPIFKEGTFESCHASTIAETRPGNFVSAWFAGSYEGASDVGIWISFFENHNWSAPVEVAKGEDSLGNPLPCWNPVLFKSRKDRLYLFYKVGKSPREWRGVVITSTDLGKTWNNPKKLPKDFLGPIKNKPVQLSNGNIICPSSTESLDSKEWKVHIEITNEELSEWKKIELKTDSGVGVIQPTLLIHPNNKLQMLCRSRQNSIFQAWSHDGGYTWSKLEPTNLPNPNSGIDGVAINDNKFLLVYNPLQSGKEWFNGRNVLNVACSNDGNFWSDIYQLENEKEGEFSYPAVIQASDKSVHITYTSKRKEIIHTILKNF